MNALSLDEKAQFHRSRMTPQELISLMQYPREWLDWDMLPQTLIDEQLARYTPGSEQASERFRSAAFHWWLRKNPSKEVLIKLIKLSYFDPDPLMSYSLRKDHIAHAENADADVVKALRTNRI